uniref:SH3 domain-containing protein n=1 Tax=Eptatretus burgeri TaxID=7764 RepID=A0A8C4QDY9_EPTBU
MVICPSSIPSNAERQARQQHVPFLVLVCLGQGRVRTSNLPYSEGAVVGLYNYTAHNCDEISFCVGQVITVTKKQHSDWWEGELGGVTGLFPSNYVKAL